MLEKPSDIEEKIKRVITAWRRKSFACEWIGLCYWCRILRARFFKPFRKKKYLIQKRKQNIQLLK